MQKLKTCWKMNNKSICSCLYGLLCMPNTVVSQLYLSKICVYISSVKTQCILWICKTQQFFIHKEPTSKSRQSKMHLILRKNSSPYIYEVVMYGYQHLYVLSFFKVPVFQHQLFLSIDYLILST